MITIAINVILYNTLGNNKVTGEEQQQIPLSAREKKLVPNLVCYMDSKRAPLSFALHFLAFKCLA